VKEVGLEPGVKETAVMYGESGELSRVRRRDSRMNRQVRDRRSGVKLMERTRKLIPETR